MTPCLRCEDFGFDDCAGKEMPVYSPSYLRYGSPNLWGRICAEHALEVGLYGQMEWTRAMMKHWQRMLDYALKEDKYDGTREDF
jgi:hypothetical protein